MDIRTYDDAEQQAREAVAAWQLLRLFSPVAFANADFPTRVRTVHGLRPILDCMHGGRFAAFVTERGGFDRADLDAMAKALASFARFHRRTFGDDEALLPIASIVSQYLIFTKLAGIPNRARILEIGSGCGYLSFFLATDPAVVRYDKIEITQSLYALQSLVDSHCYADDFHNGAVRAPARAPVGVLPLESEGQSLFAPQSTVTITAEPRSALHPWWRIDDALSRTYDVVTSNANLAEMRHGALVYYLSAIKRCLTDDGVFLIQCLGSQGGDASRPEVIKALTSFGFRPLTMVAGSHGGKQFALDNMLLIGPRHPDYHAAAESFGAPVLMRDHPLVRAVYGLDRPPGQPVSRATLVDETLKQLQRTHPSARS